MTQETQTSTQTQTESIQTETEKPTWLPEGFDKPEQLAEAYLSLKASTLKADTFKVDAETVPPQMGLPLTEELFQTVTQEYFDSGQVSVENLESLGKVGISSAMVDTYLDGLKRQGEQMKSAVFDAVGGEAEYKALVSWGQKNLSQQQRESFDQTLHSGDVNLIILAAKGLHADYRKTLEPRLIAGQASGKEMNVFRSKAEMTQAMRDPRYEKDSAFRQDVLDRLARSRF